MRYLLFYCYRDIDYVGRYTSCRLSFGSTPVKLTAGKNSREDEEWEEEIDEMLPVTIRATNGRAAKPAWLESTTRT